MKLLTKPAAFIKELFGTEATLIYADAEDTGIVLYSNVPLEGYAKTGEVYVKRLGLNSLLVISNWIDLTGRISYSPSNIGEGQRALFGSSSFGYVASAACIYTLDPEQYRRLKLEDPFYLKCPADVPLAHEGAHVILTPQKDAVVKAFRPAVSDGLRERWGNLVISEAFACGIELKYLRRAHPDVEGEWHSMRSGKNPWDQATSEIHRIAQEQGIIDEMIGLLKGSE